MTQLVGDDNFGKCFKTQINIVIILTKIDLTTHVWMDNGFLGHTKSDVYHFDW